MYRYRVLIADDDLATRELICDLFAYDRPHLHATAVTDGQAALDAHATRPFDLIVTDFRMPRLDGLSLVQRLRARHDATPIIFMSSNAHIGPKALAAGANGVLVKPFDPTRLAAMIDVLAHEGC